VRVVGGVEDDCPAPFVLGDVAGLRRSRTKTENATERKLDDAFAVRHDAPSVKVNPVALSVTVRSWSPYTMSNSAVTV